MSMRQTILWAFFSSCWLCFADAALALTCEAENDRIGVSRVLTLDTAGGGVYGTFKKQGKSILEDGEFILTFDDGPHPTHTPKILDILRRHCTKATFFAVGEMARVHSETLKAVADEGHTVGSHTWQHVNMHKTAHGKSVKDVERGFAAVSIATQGRVAPFFRFPRLRQTNAMLKYLAERNIAVFSVDVISGDTEYFQSDVLARKTLQFMRQKKKGIVLFHDLKKATVKALPKILTRMSKRGYKVVHIVPKQTLNIDHLIISNKDIPNQGPKKTLKAVSLASSNKDELKDYFGPVFKKKRKFKRFKKKKARKRRYEDNVFGLPPYWF